MVTITAPLIERATQRDSRHCMIAEALKSSYEDATHILVDLQTIRWTQKGKRYIALTPEVAAQMLVDFDQGRPIEPVSFKVTAGQVTPSTRTETPQEAAEAGRDHRREIARRGRKTVGADLTVTGGRPSPVGHLAAGIGSVTTSRTPAPEPPENASNVVRSRARFRQYGMRLLKG
jgi:hypothetical protein